MAKVKQAIDKIRVILRDTGARLYSDYELINYLNDAMDTLAVELIAESDDSMIKHGEFQDGDKLPDELVEFIGQYPFRLEWDTIRIDREPQINARYWAKFPLVHNLTDDLPYRPVYAMAVCQLAGLYALGREGQGANNTEAINTVKANILQIRRKLRAMPPTD